MLGVKGIALGVKGIALGVKDIALGAGVGVVPALSPHHMHVYVASSRMQVLVAVLLLLQQVVLVKVLSLIYGLEVKLDHLRENHLIFALRL